MGATNGNGSAYKCTFSNKRAPATIKSAIYTQPIKGPCFDKALCIWRRVRPQGTVPRLENDRAEQGVEMVSGCFDFCGGCVVGRYVIFIVDPFVSECLWDLKFSHYRSLLNIFVANLSHSERKGPQIRTERH